MIFPKHHELFFSLSPRRPFDFRRWRHAEEPDHFQFGRSLAMQPSVKVNKCQELCLPVCEHFHVSLPARCLRTWRRSTLPRARLPCRLVGRDRARSLSQDRRSVPARRRSDLLRHHHSLFRDRRGGRATRGMGRTAVCAAAPSRPQQGRPRQSASGDHRSGRNP